jgi:hypothetical protein
MRSHERHIPAFPVSGCHDVIAKKNESCISGLWRLPEGSQGNLIPKFGLLRPKEDFTVIQINNNSSKMPFLIYFSYGVTCIVKSIFVAEPWPLGTKSKVFTCNAVTA